MLHRRLRPLRWVTAAVAALGLTAGALSVAGPAHAAVFPWWDGFEDTPQNRWVIGQIAGYTSVAFVSNPPVRPHGGTSLVRLNAVWNLPALASIFATSTPDSTTPSRAVCTPEVYASAARSIRTDLIVRVREGGRTGRIISNSSASFDAEHQIAWQLIRFQPIPWQISTYTVEISAYNGQVLIDDFNIRCV